MTALDALSLLLVAAGAVFFVVGSLGLLRLPDLLSRLHALTKADNLGLGLVVMGLALQAESLRQVLQLGLVWVLLLFSSSIACFLLARSVATSGQATGESKDGH